MKSDVIIRTGTRRGAFSTALVAAAMLMLAGACGARAETAYYVAPGGRDTNPGTLAEPFATPEKARERLLMPTLHGWRFVSLHRCCARRRGLDGWKATYRAAGVLRRADIRAQASIAK